MTGTCKKCGSSGKLHIHHKDGNHENNMVGNRQPLCPSCHRLEHARDMAPYINKSRGLPLAPEYIKMQYELCHPRA